MPLIEGFEINSDYIEQIKEWLKKQNCKYLKSVKVYEEKIKDCNFYVIARFSKEIQNVEIDVSDFGFTNYFDKETNRSLRGVTI